MRRLLVLALLAAAFASAMPASAQMRGFSDTVGPTPRERDREPREPRELPDPPEPRESDSGSLTSPHSGSSPPSAWTPPVETPGLPPLREPEFAAARCETYRRQMAEVLEAEQRGQNRVAERQAIQQARLRAGC